MKAFCFKTIRKHAQLSKYSIEYYVTCPILYDEALFPKTQINNVDFKIAVYMLQTHQKPWDNFLRYMIPCQGQTRRGQPPESYLDETVQRILKVYRT